MKIEYIAQSAFLLSHDDASVLIDPWISDNPLSTTSAKDYSPDTILLSHAHNDHLGDTIEIAQRSEALVITTFELGEWLEQQGLPNVAPANHGGTVQFKGGSTKIVPAWHSSSYTLPSGEVVANGVPAGHIIRFGGKTIYFSGDTCLFSDMKLIGEEGIDIAILCIGDFYTMGPTDAVRAVKFVEPAVVIPCHYNTFPPIEQDPLAFKADVETNTPARCEVLSPGQTLEIA